MAFLDHKNLNFNFRNNIFVSKSGKVYDRIKGENFQGNYWFSLANNSVQDSLNFIAWASASNQEKLNGKIVGNYTNPRFVNPGNSNITNPELLSRIDDYKLKLESLLIDKGLDLELLFGTNTGVRDYFGVPIHQGMAFNMGVDQFADIQEIRLIAGWNIFSANLAPADANLMNILKPLIDSNKLVKVMDEAGNTLEDRGIFGGWTNTIGNINFTEGYAIKVASDCKFEIRGGNVNLPVNIPLSKGWNIISWPVQFEHDGIAVFQTLINEGKLKKVMDEKGQTIEDWGTFGGWKNSIGNFTPGEGYKVNVTEDCTLTVYENIVKSKAIISKLITTTHFIPSYIGNGFNHMNINVVNLPVNVLNIGDELAVFDKEICVGAVKVQSHHLQSLTIPVIASASDNLGANGFTEGNTVTLKVWNSRQNKESEIIPSVLAGTSHFTKNGTSFLSLKSLTTTRLEDSAILEDSKIKCYPNPFSNGLTVEIVLENDSKVQVEVLNQLGQRVKVIYPQNELNSGKHQIRWNGENAANQTVPAGIYIIKATIGNKILFDKVICQ